MFIDKIYRKFDQVLAALGSLDEDLQYLIRRSKESEKLLAFVYGTAVSETYGYEPNEVGTFQRGEAKKLEVSIGSAPVYMRQGDTVMLRIDPMMKLEDVILNVEPPFVIQDVIVGRDSVFAICSNAASRIVGVKSVQVGMRLSVQVSWPKDGGA